jgi:hypothetical protein
MLHGNSAFRKTNLFFVDSTPHENQKVKNRNYVVQADLSSNPPALTAWLCIFEQGRV